MRFVHLRTKSEYSLLDSLLTAKKLSKLASDNKMEAIGLMDNFSLSGAFVFSKLNAEKGIKPILGLNMIVLEDDKMPDNRCGLGFLIKNKKGYQNAIELITRSQFQYPELSSGRRYVKLEDVKECSEGLICISGGRNGLITSNYLFGNEKVSDDYLQYLKSVFDNDFFIELTRHGRSDEKKAEEYLLKKAKQLNIPVVATNDVNFEKPEQRNAHHVVCCIREGSYISEKHQWELNDQYYFKTEEEMVELFSDIPEAINNTVKIAKKCSFMVEPHSPMLPSFAKSQSEEDQSFRDLSRAGLEKRMQFNTIEKLSEEQEKEYIERLEYELKIILQMGFAGYFLIVSDFIKYAKDNKIPVGPGRGSGAGSIVAWSLGITDVDPMYYGLLFERFLNPDRVSMPDFDIDFCPLRRHEVIEYVQKKYGHENVASIITFGKLSTKAVLKDVGRVLQIPYSRVDQICKMIPFNPLEPVSLSKAIEMDEQLKNEILSDDETRELIEIALQAEGLYRHSSVHAAGIIISSEKIGNIMPVHKDQATGLMISGFDMKAAESVGLVKFDFLGLRTLSIIHETCKTIKENRGEEVDIDTIDVFDPEVLKFLSSMNTKGIFQLEAKVPKEALHAIKVNGIKDISVITSLNRPGPMENMPVYIRRKNNLEPIECPHESLKELLEETCGIIVYQEQVMSIVRIMAGYSLGQADILRRAIGKKILEEMDKQRKIFVEGSVKNGIAEKLAIDIFAKLAKFAGYGFNKSHAVAYSIISYQTAYLKTHYLIEFLTSMMNFAIDNTDKITEVVSDIKYAKIPIMMPSVNTTECKFYIKDNSIVYSVAALKSLSKDTVAKIVEERKNGKFTDVFDFCKRCGSFLNKRQFESIVKSNSLSEFNIDQNQLIESTKELLAYGSDGANSNTDQFSLLDDCEIESKMPTLSNKFIAVSQEDISNNELFAFGFYIKNHPLQSSYDFLRKIKVTDYSELVESVDAGQRKNALISGVLTKIRQRVGGRGRFAFLSVTDFAGSYEIALFNDKMINEKRDILIEGNSLIMKVEIKNEGINGIRVNCKEMYAAQDVIDRKVPFETLLADLGESEIKQFKKRKINKKVDSVQRAEAGNNKKSKEIEEVRQVKTEKDAEVRQEVENTPENFKTYRKQYLIVELLSERQKKDFIKEIYKHFPDCDKVESAPEKLEVVIKVGDRSERMRIQINRKELMNFLSANKYHYI